MGLLNINEFLYPLPSERIALYPLEKRDESKLLVYQNKAIEHSSFYNLTDFLPSNSFLFFNNTKVIPARLNFKKDTGAEIEIFLLNPTSPSVVLSETMQTTKHCIWQCTIGNLKRWTSGVALIKKIGNIILEATLENRELNLVQFRWTTAQSFAEVVRLAGETPLPPYLKRKAEASDLERYQTIYSRNEGAVAAPTAGLHFTDRVFASLESKGIGHDFLTLHVSAGTFQPVKTANANEHIMHHEQVVVSKKNVKNLLHADRKIVPVGTTSMRTLESLYWFGAKLVQDEHASFNIQQEDPYTQPDHPPKHVALQAVVDYMNKKNIETLVGETAIFIKPGYAFKVCDALITNFHQPGSTLMLLVAAFVGEDWKRIYNEALTNNYRFLSYGDSSLLIPK